MKHARLKTLIGVLCSIGLLIALLGTGAFANDVDAPSHASDLDPDYATVFPAREFLEFAITLHGPNSDQAGDDFSVVLDAKLQFLGLSWEQVEITIPREGWIAWPDDGGSFPMHLRFSSPARPEQRFYGFTELELLPTDPTHGMAGTKLMLDAIRRVGIPTRRAAVAIAAVRFGDLNHQAVYALVEPAGVSLLDTQYDEDDGALYAVEGPSATFSTRDPHAYVLLQPADEEWNVPSAEVLFDSLNAPSQDPIAWRIQLEQHFDVYEFLRLLATRAALGATVGYGRTLEPILLYWDPGDERFHWLPGLQHGAMPIGSTEMPPLALDLGNLSEEWLLLRRLIEDPAYFATYLSYLEESKRGVLDVPRLQAEVRAIYEALIPRLAQATPSDLPPLPTAEEAQVEMEQFLLAIESRVVELEEFVWEHRLRPSPIVISELHYNPSLTQGIDNNFEFIELYNRGNTTVDLSGYRFIEGLEFGLPPGTRLAPGQCLLISKRAQTYRDAPCEVQQWARGSLSNGGEVVRLLDRAGVEVDSVKYDDVPPWPEEADSGDASLEIIDPGKPNYTHDNWRASEQVGGSPGWIAP